MADPNKLGLLNALAQSGSAGASDYQAQVASQNAAKTQAVQSASQRAGLINAPAALLAQNQATVSEPYNTAISAANANAGAMNKYLGAMSGAHNNYLSELKAAQPVLQASVNKAYAKAQAAALKRQEDEQAARDADWREGLRFQWAMQDRSTEQDEKAKEAQSAALSKQGLAKIASHNNANLRDTGLDIVANADDLGTALGLLNDSETQKNLKKLGVNGDELKQYLMQYYAPETYALLPQSQPNVAAPAAPAPAPAPAPAAKSGGKKKPSNPFAGLIEGFTHGIGVRQ